MTYNYTECRTLGHSWDQIPTTRRPPWGILVTYRCTRCSTIREDCLDSNYALSYRRYDHPSDYKSDSRSKDEWRAEMLKSPSRRSMTVRSRKKEQ